MLANKVFGKIYVVIESVSIQSFKNKVTSLTFIVTEGVSIIHGFIKSLIYSEVILGGDSSVGSSSTSGSSTTSSTSSDTTSSSTSEVIGDFPESVDGNTYNEDGTIIGGS